MQTRKQKGPVAVVESKSHKIGIYRTGAAYTLVWYTPAGRQREKRKSLSLAKERASEVLKGLANGAAQVSHLSARETMVVTDAAELLATIGVPLSDAVRQFVVAKRILGTNNLETAATHYMEFLSKVEIPTVPMQSVVTEFLAAANAQGRSKRYIEDCTSRLTKAAKDLAVPISSLTAPTIDKWLDGLKTSGRTRNNYRAALTTLFSFARTRG